MIRLDEGAGPPPQLASYRKDARLRSDSSYEIYSLALCTDSRSCLQCASDEWARRRSCGWERGDRNGLGKAWGLAFKWQPQRAPIGGGDPTRRFGHRGRGRSGALDCNSAARRTADAVRMLRSENVFPGFPRSGDHSAAAARGLGHVCRGQERFVVAAGFGRDRFPHPSRARSDGGQRPRWWRPSAHRARSRSLRRCVFCPRANTGLG